MVKIYRCKLIKILPYFYGSSITAKIVYSIGPCCHFSCIRVVAAAGAPAAVVVVPMTDAVVVLPPPEVPPPDGILEQMDGFI